ncbi:MAG: hypothetical protein HOL28_03440 [Crocinitomicaceae bacterium]|jgi:peptidyl-prolyl cis-trans isomerase SurA|nr:hypothetical protein [Crocinitomicaceae bacterium]MBT5402477.1 hypothetical protein [Crocinitomicaceae bacterium]
MKNLILGFSLMLIAGAGYSQDDPIVMSVNGTDVTKSEFEHIFKKNNKDEDITKEDIDEYLELFVNFKLKVTAAEELGMDTVKKFKDELGQYREQLAQPYLIDQKLNEQLMKEAYDHMCYEVKASHILVKLERGDKPADTLKAYNKIVTAKKRIEGGESFGTVAFEVSEDPSAKQNKGSLGYFTAFKMVYSFENAAYNTEPGKLSEIIKTRFGYHLLQVEDKRKARGTRLAAHILIRAEDDLKEKAIESEAKAREIYNKLKEGSTFEQMAKQFSEDRNSAATGGKLKWFGAGDLISEFDEALFALKENGDFSEPVKTRFGWHIIQLLDSKKLGSYDELKGEIKSKISKDARNTKTKASFITQLKDEYNYTVNKKVMDAFIKSVDSSLVKGKYSYEKNNLDKKWLIEFAENKLTAGDFGEYLENKQKKSKTKSKVEIVQINFNKWVDKALINYEKSQLERKYVKYKMLMKEYRDGILLFELTDEMVWAKAVKDTSGLKSFYEENKADFVWKERVDADFYHCIDKKAFNQVESLLKLGKERDSIAIVVNTDSPLNVNVKSMKEEISSLEYVESKLKVGSNGPFEFNGQLVLIHVKEIIAPGNKEFKEAKGIITAAYQDHLEKKWIKELKSRFAVEINKDVLYTIH